MTKLNPITEQRPFANEKALKSAIFLVNKAVKEDKESSSQQELLDEAHDQLDCMLVRDFSGIVSNSPENVIEIVRNHYVLDDFAVEVNYVEGGTEFMYLPAEQALSFLKNVLANINKQVPEFSHNLEPIQTNKNMNDRKYKSIYEKVVSDFNEQVVSLLEKVDGNNLSLNEAISKGDVFADKMTDAMFFAWSCNYKHDEVAEGCIYDYLASGDKCLLKEDLSNIQTQKKKRKM